MKWWSNSVIFERAFKKIAPKYLKCYELLHNGVVWVLVNSVMESGFCKLWRISPLIVNLLVYQERLYSKAMFG